MLQASNFIEDGLAWEIVPRKPPALELAEVLVRDEKRSTSHCSPLQTELHPS